MVLTPAANPLVVVRVLRREENCLEVLRQSAGLARAAAPLFARNEIDAKFGRRAAGKQSRMLRSFFERADCA